MDGLSSQDVRTMHWLVHTWLDCSLVHCRKALQCTRKDQMIYYVVDMMNVLWNPPAWILMAFRLSFQNAIRMSSISFRYNLWIYISIAANIICLQSYLLWLEPSSLILKISNAWLLPSTAIWSPLVISSSSITFTLINVPCLLLYSLK